MIYIYKLFKKLGTNNRLDLALYARNNMISDVRRRGMESRPTRLRLLKPKSARELLIN